MRTHLDFFMTLLKALRLHLYSFLLTEVLLERIFLSLRLVLCFSAEVFDLKTLIRKKKNIALS